MLTSSLVARFAAFFPGRTDAWGAIQGRAKKEKVTLAHYRRHVEGVTFLGIYPMRTDSTVKWLAIDVDVMEAEPSLRLLTALGELGLHEGVYLERSKSKSHRL